MPQMSEELVVAEALEQLRNDSSLFGRVTKPIISSVKGRLWAQPPSPPVYTTEKVNGNEIPPHIGTTSLVGKNGRNLPPVSEIMGRAPTPTLPGPTSSTAVPPAPKAWRNALLTATSLVLTTENRRKLRHLLRLLRLANDQLSSKIDAFKQAVAAESEEVKPELSVDAIRQDIATTVRKSLTVISTYASGALPEVARGLVRDRIMALPERWAANTTSSQQSAALSLATDSLDMIRTVTEIVASVLDRADAWCVNLGKRTRDNDDDDKEASDLDEQLPPPLARQTSVDSAGTEAPSAPGHSHKASRVES